MTDITRINIRPKPDLRERWTVLEVDERAIKKVNEYARETGQKTGSALSEIILVALSK